MRPMSIPLCLTVFACSTKTPDAAEAVEPPQAPAAPAAPAAPEAPPPPIKAEGPATSVAVQTDAGEVVITPVYHASTMLTVGGKTVWLDPWSKAKLDDKAKADVVLITDVHFDHMDPDALAAVSTDATVLLAPAAVAKELGRDVAYVLANGESAEVSQVPGLTVTAVPMYNNVRGPEEGGVFHEKGRGNGYLLAFGGKTLYFAGDTECTDEMKALTGVDMAFIPMNLPYTMTPEEAAACVTAFAPTQVVPYHYAGSDLAAFEAGVGESAQVVRAEFYPGGLPW